MPSETIFVESCHDKTSIETRITFNGNVNGATATAPAVILAHPYGPLGGNMRNNVIIALHNYFASKGYVTVCINFRGCGHSKGRTSWTGMPERGDYEAVIQYLKTSSPCKLSHLIIGGYSFGSMIAASLRPSSEDFDIPYSYLLISYPVSVQWALTTVRNSFFTQQINGLLRPAATTTGFEGSNHKVLVLYGDHDQFTGVRSYQNWLKNAGQHVESVIIPEADHFWFEHENNLVRKVNDWIVRAF
ncbi:Alpha/Beta hydrolase protein [Phascolomyces articulosus]|uniref:Alpha/Beta hydrolase protein n=1 Tax=Phascolomyces articulosus TaxID=60185 RepID=A0AAD5PEP8_9FUNG|nr:Alpha/Beta hydrolase protein [Phascolomyces articulosus]